MQKTSVGSRFRSCALASGLALGAFTTPVAIAQTGNTASVVMYYWGVTPQGKLTTANNGDLVGTASESQISGTAGLFYRVNSNAAGVGTIYEYGRLGIYTGGGPRAGLLRASDGNLYGTTTYNNVDPLRGTQTGVGTIFRMTQEGAAYTKLREFDVMTRDARGFFINQDGAIPFATLTEGPLEGGVRYLFGVTFQGGLNGVGTIFKIHPNGTTAPIAIHHFGQILCVAAAITDPPTPPNPVPCIADDRTQKLRTNIDGGNHTINADGTNPDRTLILGSDNRLYGVVTNGGAQGTGFIFAIETLPHPTTGEYAFTELHVFAAPPDIPVDVEGTDENEALSPRVNEGGAYPAGGLVQGPNGLLYGTTSSYGPKSFGTVFSMKTDGTEFTTLVGFTGPDATLTGVAPGAGPSGDLIVDGNGDLVGTFSSYGFRDDAKTVVGAGGIFKVDLDNGNAYTVPFVFPNPDNDPVGAYNYGYSPSSGVIQDSNGNFYGIAGAGGAAGGGSLFKFGTPNTNPGLGVPPAYDDGRGSMSLWWLCALLALAGWRLAGGRRNHGARA